RPLLLEIVHPSGLLGAAVASGAATGFCQLASAEARCRPASARRWRLLGPARQPGLVGPRIVERGVVVERRTDQVDLEEGTTARAGVLEQVALVRLPGRQRSPRQLLQWATTARRVALVVVRQVAKQVAAALALDHVARAVGDHRQVEVEAQGRPPGREPAIADRRR